ncbi:branched-chain amino acid aminotransferase [Rozella allomycis CSF55]|uniref:Branched-chain-amino-acid aminotransferase n=1 Tax=Rozella allomycis (strain CSF55) TaxID=988480 RepID=A0A4P9YG42_ROZAC|nr:branched-chain amino acid aminotransferase [Rozella allomycis CSF55]
MLEIDWSQKSGWEKPTIHEFANLNLSPASVVFRYGSECFEGLKAYKDKNGEIRMFRPMKNMDRLYLSAERLALPTFDKNEVLECMKKLVKIDSSWIPRERGYSLYIRPTLIATQDTLGVGPSAKAKFFTIMSPVGPYFKSGFAPVSLVADNRYARAWPGGVGSFKVGGNYAPCIKPQLEAATRGYHQNLWLFGEELTEVGTMNCFVFWKNENGERELITPHLDGTILPGVTRDSILTLTREWKEFKVTEGRVTMSQLIRAIKENRLIEMFGAGTACIVCPIERINYKGIDYKIPIDENLKAGKLTKRLMDTILAIQYGEVDHEWSIKL